MLNEYNKEEKTMVIILGIGTLAKYNAIRIL